MKIAWNSTFSVHKWNLVGKQTHSFIHLLSVAGFKDMMAKLNSCDGDFVVQKTVYTYFPVL